MRHVSFLMRIAHFPGRRRNRTWFVCGARSLLPVASGADMLSSASDTQGERLPGFVASSARRRVYCSSRAQFVCPLESTSYVAIRDLLVQANHATCWNEASAGSIAHRIGKLTLLRLRHSYWQNCIKIQKTRPQMVLQSPTCKNDAKLKVFLLFSYFA